VPAGNAFFFVLFFKLETVMRRRIDPMSSACGNGFFFGIFFEVETVIHCMRRHIDPMSSPMPAGNAFFFGIFFKSGNCHEATY